MFKNKEFLKILNPPQSFSRTIDRIKNKKAVKGDVILEIKNMNFHYPNKVRALNNINLQIYKGDFLGIVGLNGSGKSTLALNIIGLLSGSGSILLNKEEISKKDVYQRTRDIGYVFQNPNYQLFEDNVFKEIAFGPKNLNLNRKEVRERTEEALDVINLEEFAEEDPHSLSVGQKRRVTIASVLAMKPKIIIIDEPDTGVDYRNAERLMDYIKELQKKGHTIILISHNLQLVEKYCNRVIYLENGEIKDIKHFMKKVA